MIYWSNIRLLTSCQPIRSRNITAIQVVIGGRQERQEREAIKWSLKINISRSSSVYRERRDVVQNAYTDLDTRAVTCRPGPLVLKAACFFFVFLPSSWKVAFSARLVASPSGFTSNNAELFFFFFQISIFRRPQHFTVQGEGLKCLWAHNNMWYHHDIT